MTLPHDGKTFGRLQVRGAFVARAYFKGDGGRILDDDGYFDTGDVATIDPAGYMQITDRAKDVIKSGGEWISSIEIENIAAGHPKALIAAVIRRGPPQMGGAPFAARQTEETARARRPRSSCCSWRARSPNGGCPTPSPSSTKFPLGATGKIDKKLIRQRFEEIFAGGLSRASTEVARRQSLVAAVQGRARPSELDGGLI